MEQLRNTMSNLVDIDYALVAFIGLLDSLEEIYDLKHEQELKQNMWVLRIIAKSLEAELNDNIEMIDKFLIEHRE